MDTSQPVYVRLCMQNNRSQYMKSAEKGESPDHFSLHARSDSSARPSSEYFAVHCTVGSLLVYCTHENTTPIRVFHNDDRLRNRMWP